MRILVSTLAILILFGFPSFGICQTALNAPPGDPVYQAIDLFIAHRLADNVIIGQRPYSRLEVARILREARKSLDLKYDYASQADLEAYSQMLGTRNYIDRVLSYYENEYAIELSGMKNGVSFGGLERMDMQAVYDSSSPRTIPPDNGAGSINGLITSFDRYGPGFTYVEGINTYITTHHSLYASRYFAFLAEPRFAALTQTRGDSQVWAQVYKLYATSGWRNIQIEVGRDNLLWGQGENGGLMLSDNARPLDMLKISNPYPWRAPWIFKYLGYMKWTLFVSNLGPDNTIPYTYFYGMKWTLRPHRCVELGFSETLMMGGRGAPKISFWDPVTDMFPIHKWGAANIGAADISNHSFGFFDLRVTIPPLRNSMLYYDAYIEDSIVRAYRLPGNILNQMAFIVGWYTPRVTSKGDVGLRLEYHHLAPLTYRHGRWATGYTLNQRLMGDALGPAADGVYATAYWKPTPKFNFRFDFAYEDYDSSRYYTELSKEGGGDRILKDVYGIHEYRGRAVAGVDWRVKKRYGLSLSGGYERIQNWAFSAGRSVNNAMLGLGVSLYFDEFSISSH